MRTVLSMVLILGVILPAFSATAAKKLAHLPPEARAVEGETNLYTYRRGKDWSRLQKWVKRHYGEQSRIEPVIYANGVPLLTVVSQNPRFGWTHIHFYKVRRKIFISVVPKEPVES